MASTNFESKADRLLFLVIVPQTILHLHSVYSVSIITRIILYEHSEYHEWSRGDLKCL
jgi:hypothetical protein